MHLNNVVDVAILHCGSNGFIRLHCCNELVSSPLYLVEIWPNFKEYLFQRNPFNGRYHFQNGNPHSKKQTKKLNERYNLNKNYFSVLLRTIVMSQIVINFEDFELVQKFLLCSNYSPFFSISKISSLTIFILNLV